MRSAEATADDPLPQRQLAIAKQTGRPVLILPEPPAKDQLSAVIASVQERLESERRPAVSD